MDLIIVTILIILLTWLLNLWRTRAYVKVAFDWPSNRLHTWLGCGPILDSGQKYLWDYAEKYGSDSVLWCGPFSFFLTSKPETIQDILTSKNCVDKPSLIYGGLEVLFGKGLVSNSDPDWSRHRKIFDKAFSNKNLCTFTPIFRKEVANTINCMEENAKLGKSIDMLTLCKELTIRTSFKTIVKNDMGLNFTKFIDNLHSILLYAADACGNFMLKIKFIRYLTEITIYREVKRTMEEIRQVFYETLAIAKRNDKNDPRYVADIVSPIDYGYAAIEQNVLNYEEMLNNIEHIISGAFETTSTALFSIICMLAMHPEWQERVYEEVVNWMPGNDNENDIITFDQVNQLIYLDMVMNETMRLLPLIPLVFRTVANQNLKLSNGGQILPVGQMIAIDIYRLHRNKDVWGPNANRFNPYNFSHENSKERHPYAFIPFTKGKRFCIGYRYAILSLKITLAELIKSFVFDTDFKYEDIKIINHITLQFVEEPKIKVQQRVPKPFKIKG